MKFWRNIKRQKLEVKGGAYWVAKALEILRGFAARLEEHALERALAAEEDSGVSLHWREYEISWVDEVLLFTAEPLRKTYGFRSRLELAFELQRIGQRLLQGSTADWWWREVVGKRVWAREMQKIAARYWGRKKAEGAATSSRESEKELQALLSRIKQEWWLEPALRERLNALPGRDERMQVQSPVQLAVVFLRRAAELRGREEERREERLRRLLGDNAAWLTAREAIAALEAAQERGRLSDAAVAALGMAVAIAGVSTLSPALLGEEMNRGAERALYWAAKWKEGARKIPLADFVWGNTQAEVMRDRARRMNKEAKKEEMQEELEAFEDELTVEESGELAWRLDVRHTLEQLGLGEDEIYLLEVWAEEGVEAAAEALGGIELREAVTKWAAMTVERLRSDEKLRALWQEI